MAFGTLFAFRLKDQSTTATSRLSKKLYGQATSSGGYSYRRKGLLDEIPHRRLIRGVFVLREKDAPAVRRLLRELGCEIHERRVELTPADERALTE